MKGEIENIPLPDNSVDVVISNCVINLSGDKDRVLDEAFRVLKPGGRLAVSDVVVRGNVPAEIKKSIELWVGCVAGALSDYESALGPIAPSALRDAHLIAPLQLVGFRRFGRLFGRTRQGGRANGCGQSAEILRKCVWGNCFGFLNTNFELEDLFGCVQMI